MAKKLTADQERIAQLEALLAEANAQAQKTPRTAKAKSLELKAEREAMTAHLTDEQMAALANAVPAPHYTYVVTSERIGVGATSDLTHPTDDEFLILTEPARQANSKKSNRGKPASGVRKTPVHLDRAQVLEVVALWNEGHGMSKSAIATKFNVNPTFIANIVSGKEHSKVTGIVYTKKESK